MRVMLEASTEKGYDSVTALRGTGEAAMPLDVNALTFDQINELLHYDPEAGKLWWKVKTSKKIMIGMEAGCTKACNVNSNGTTRSYRYVRVFGKSMPVARVAWLLTHGEWPVGKIFFEDGNQMNLKASNLRMSNSLSVKYDHDDPRAHADYARDHREKFPMDWKDTHLRAKFDITLAEYGQMLLAQNGVCAICSNEEKATRGGKPKALAVDHDHATGKNRALLCSECNQMLGKAKDNREILLAAVKYLDKHAGREAAKPVLTVVPTEALK